MSEKILHRNNQHYPAKSLVTLSQATAALAILNRKTISYINMRLKEHPKKSLFSCPKISQKIFLKFPQISDKQKISPNFRQKIPSTKISPVRAENSFLKISPNFEQKYKTSFYHHKPVITGYGITTDLPLITKYHRR